MAQGDAETPAQPRGGPDESMSPQFGISLYKIAHTAGLNLRAIWRLPPIKPDPHSPRE
jgi:hypothetical protein